jgi:hypothetical protein
MKYCIAGLLMILAHASASAEESSLCLSCADAYVKCDENCFRDPRTSKTCVKRCEASYADCRSTCADKGPLADASVPDALLGRYEGWSRACEGDIFSLTQGSVTFGDCNEQPFQLLEADERHVVINIPASASCSAKVIKFEKEKPDPNGLSFGGYVLKWGKTQKQIDSRCNFGSSKAPFVEPGDQ